MDGTRGERGREGQGRQHPTPGHWPTRRGLRPWGCPLRTRRPAAPRRPSRQTLPPAAGPRSRSGRSGSWRTRPLGGWPGRSWGRCGEKGHILSSDPEPRRWARCYRTPGPPDGAGGRSSWHCPIPTVLTPHRGRPGDLGRWRPHDGARGQARTWGSTVPASPTGSQARGAHPHGRRLNPRVRGRGRGAPLRLEAASQSVGGKHRGSHSESQPARPDPSAVCARCPAAGTAGPASHARGPVPAANKVDRGLQAMSEFYNSVSYKYSQALKVGPKPR